jgi:hypothetical protein
MLLRNRNSLNAGTLNEDAYRELVKRREPDYFFPPHGGRPPSDQAVREATQRYVDQEKK